MLERSFSTPCSRGASTKKPPIKISTPWQQGSCENKVNSACGSNVRARRNLGLRSQSRKPLIPWTPMNETDALRNELSRARSTVLQLIPERIRDVLVTYRSCGSMSQLREWQHETAQKVMEFA